MSAEGAMVGEAFHRGAPPRTVGVVTTHPTTMTASDWDALVGRRIRLDVTRSMRGLNGSYTGTFVRVRGNGDVLLDDATRVVLPGGEVFTRSRRAVSIYEIDGVTVA